MTDNKVKKMHIPKWVGGKTQIIDKLSIELAMYMRMI